jgi:hypothetical protein
MDKQEVSRVLLSKIYNRGTHAVGWFLLYLLITQGSFQSLVLCFGVNGHIAVETPHTASHRPLSQEAGPCLDFPLVSVSTDARWFIPSLVQVLQNLCPIVGVALLSVPVLLLPDHALWHATLVLTPPVAFFHSVVLRI